MQEASRTPKRPDQNRTTPWHIIIKTTNTETRERVLKAAIRRIIVQGKPGQIVHKIPSPTQPEYKGLEVWLKRKSACFASVKPSSNPSHKLKQQQNYE
jgi:hypothetical protein